MKKLVYLVMLIALVLQSFAPAIDVLAKEAEQLPIGGQGQVDFQEDATATPTPSITPEDESVPSETPTPQDEATAFLTETPLASETPLETGTALPTETPQPPTAEASVTPTSSPTEAADLSAQPYQILLEASPAFATPGGKITISWDIPAVAAVAGAELQLVFLFSPGMLPDPEEKQVGAFDSEKRTYTLPASAQGKFKLVIDEKAQAPFMIEALLVENEQVIGTSLLDFPERTALSREGGKVAAFNGNLKIRFPKDSVPADAEVLVGRVKDQNIPTGGLVGAPFEVTVYTLPSGKAPQSLQSREVKKFKEPLVLEIAYDESAIRGDERDLQLFYWNTEVGSWFTVPSRVDPEANILTGYSDHLTVFGMGINDFQIAKPPTLEGFQVSEFTGAAAYSYPLDLPAGPGGLQPQLSLNYNSQVVDQATGSTQASWIGFGWSMDVLGIERNTGGTNFDQRDDTFSLTLNGVGGMLLPGADGYYHTSDESFVRVQKNADDTWSVWDKVGNVYFFDKRAFYSAPGQASVTWRWSLTWMENIHGQRLTYDYFNQPGTEGYVSTIQAVYPRSILYPDGRTRIWFDYSSDNERKDYEASWKASNVLHQRYFLKSVSVQRDTDLGEADGNFETTVRKYELAYETESAKMVLPSIEWNNGEAEKGRNLTLKSITEYGLGSAQSLPATTFIYGDKMHLTEANNGYGGKVKFTYENYVNDENRPPWHAPGASKSRTVEHIYGLGESGNYCKTDGSSTTVNGGWETGTEGGTIPWCSGGYLYINSSMGQNPTFISPLESRSMLKPGAYYRLVASISSSSSTESYARIGIGISSINNGTVQGIYGSSKSIGTTTPTGFDEIIYFDSTAPYGYVLIDTVGAKLSNFSLQLLPTFYRVIKKEIYVAGQSVAQGELSYSYAGASMNTAAISAVANTTQPLSEPGSEFRGHSQVTVTGTDGTKTVTTYCQSDECKGKPLTVTTSTSDVSGIPLWERIYEYESAPTAALHPGFELRAHVVPTVGAESWPLVTGLSIDWNRTKSVTSKIYASDGSYSATRELYSYESPYGNQTQVERQEKNGDGWFTTVRIKTDYATSINTAYLVGLPRQVTQFDSSGNLLGASQYAYDGLEVGQPVVGGKLTTVRTMAELLEPDDRNRYHQVSYEYDAWGNRTIEKTWTGYAQWNASPTTGEQKTTTVFDSTYHTYPISIKNQLEHITTWSYNPALGLPLTETDPNGAVTIVVYDDFGRLTNLARPGDVLSSPTIKIAYFDTANPFRIELSQKIEGAQYLTLRRYYDGMGRQFKTETGNTVSGQFSLYNTVETLFDSATVTRQSVPYGAGETPVYSTSEIRYEGGTKISLVSNPDGSQTSSVTNGLTTTVTDPVGRFTISQADAWGRTISVTPPEGPGVSYAYDLLGRLLTATRGGATTSLTYDAAGRKIGMSDPDMGNWYYKYDALGNLVAQVDAKKQAINLCYDPLNRLLGKTYTSNVADPAAYQRPDCPPLDFYTVLYYYDQGINGIGRRTGMRDASTGSGSTTWAYDARGRVTIENKRIGSQIYTTQWDYNSADLPKTMIYPGGEEVTNTYDPNMLLESVVGADTYVQSTSYDSAGRITGRTLGNGLVQNYDYYDWAEQGGRLQSLITASLQNLAYQYDLAGNVSQIQDTTAAETQSYGYDNLDRLIKWTLNGSVQEAYSYDPFTGNLAWRDAADNVEPVLDPMMVDLVAWWGLDETIEGRANQHGNDSLVPYGIVGVVPGQKGNSASFSPATPGRLHQEDLPQISTGNISFTLAAQVYLTNLTGTGIIANKGEKMNMTQRDYTLSVSSGVFSFRVGNGVTSAVVSSAAVTAVQWHTVVAWHDAENDTINIQVDNGAVASVAYSDGASDTAFPLTVGAFADNTYVLNGRVDELALYKRLLTADERAWLHNNGQGRAYAEIPEPVLPPEIDLAYAYDDSAHAHAVTDLIPETGLPNTYAYDANGNQITRTITRMVDGNAVTETFALAYDAENRLVEVKKDGTTIAQFTYDGDGRQVKSVIDGVTTRYVGAHYEVQGSEITKYYFAGARRIAMRKYTVPVSSTLEFILGDHLGSTSITTDATGAKTSELRYSPWGEVRYSWTKDMIPSLPTDYTFTGQRSYMDDPTTGGATEGFGLMFYNARWYDPALARFAQADTIVTGAGNGSNGTIGDVANNQYTALTTGYYETAIVTKLNQDNAFLLAKGGLSNLTEEDKQRAHIVDVPLSTQVFDRYAYGLNNPLRYKDPTGHASECGNFLIGCKKIVNKKGETVWKIWVYGKKITVRETDKTRDFLNKFKTAANAFKKAYSEYASATLNFSGAVVTTAGIGIAAAVGIGALEIISVGTLTPILLPAAFFGTGSVMWAGSAYDPMVLALNNLTPSTDEASMMFDELTPYNDPNALP